MTIPVLVMIVGPPAVGKMTVGAELCRRTGYRLLNNHMTIDLVTAFFEFGTAPFVRLVDAFRQQLLDEISHSDLPGAVHARVGVRVSG
jgi:cytidylate kinase